MTIGRDTFWTPAHLAIYLGGVVGGLASGAVALHTTFRGNPAQRGVSVRFWGFRAPLGAWVSIWGAFAMLTSAPFDDWWHNAYGLDVEILSPPHLVLALGMVGLAFGAMLVTLAAQNRSGRDDAGRWALWYTYAAGCVLSFLAIMTTEYSFRTLMHSSLFYQVSCAAFPFFLVATGLSARHRWGTTLVAGSYTLIRAAMLWILPLFPAQPGLGPIYQDVTHMVPMDFPLLLLAPAVVMDLLRARMGSERTWRLALAQGAAFFAVFLGVQWLFADFLVSPYSRNWFFATDNFPYYLPTSTNYYKGIWARGDSSVGHLLRGLGYAAILSMVSATVGAAFGRGLRRVQR
ncbi:MAG: hypothetical protein ABIZ91_04945 [Gemmatimonadaceae bacterium]